jgi:hypothetical protein
MMTDATRILLTIGVVPCMWAVRLAVEAWVRRQPLPAHLKSMDRVMDAIEQRQHKY